MKPWQAILILVCLVASFTAGYHIRGDVASDTGAVPCLYHVVR